MPSILIEKIADTEKKSMKQIFNMTGMVYTFLNPVSYLIALKNKSIFIEFDGIFVDGSLLALSILLFYGKRVIRKSFDMTSMASNLLTFAEVNRKSIYIVASEEEQVEKAIAILKMKYPKLIIIGYRNGYFQSESDMEKEVQHITELNPYFLIVGMGALMQELFLLKVRQVGYQGIGFSCGGFIHQISKNEIDYYPTWIDKFNLRFIYRMYKEKHTRKRYIQASFFFPIMFIYERLFRK